MSFSLDCGLSVDEEEDEGDPYVMAVMKSVARAETTVPTSAWGDCSCHIRF